MDIRCSKLRTIRINTFSDIIHPYYGLAWTDGTKVGFVDIHCSVAFQNSKSLVLPADFENVSGVQWDNFDSEIAFLSILQKRCVSVWRISGGYSDLKVENVESCKIETIACGIFWHPKDDIITVLSKIGCEIFGGYRTIRKSSKWRKLAVEHGRTELICGCWLSSKMLALATVISVLMYKWADNEDLFAGPFSILTWKIPNNYGKLVGLQVINNNRLLCSTELSIMLTPMTQENNSDIIGPKLANSNQPNLFHLMNIAQGLLPDDKNTGKSLLLLLQLNLLKADENSRNWCEVLFSYTLPSILSPDLIRCLPCNEKVLVVISGNTSNTLEIVDVAENSINTVFNAKLDPKDRVKGLCWCNSGDNMSFKILAMIGVPYVQDLALPSSSGWSTYDLRMQSLSVPLDISTQYIPLDTVRHSKKHIDVGICELSSEPANSVPCAQNFERKQALEELSCSRFNRFSPVTPETLCKNKISTVKLPDNESIKVNKQASLADTIIKPNNKLGNSQYRIGDNVVHIDQDVRIQCLESRIFQQEDQIETLKNKLEILKRQLDAFAAIVYPTLQECEYVNIICHFPQKPDVSKMFLLSGGKLQLDVVKSAFSVDNLIVILDNGLQLYVGSNEDGYIPIRFKHQSVIHFKSE